MTRSFKCGQFALLFFLIIVSCHRAASSPTSAITFTNFPAYFQLYARDASNSSTVPITGVVTTTGYDSVIAKVYKSGGLWKQFSKRLSYNTGAAAFDLSTQIIAALKSTCEAAAPLRLRLHRITSPVAMYT